MHYHERMTTCANTHERWLRGMPEPVKVHSMSEQNSRHTTICFNTYTVHVSGTVLTAHFHGDIFILVEVDSGVVDSKQFPVQQMHLHATLRVLKNLWKAEQQPRGEPRILVTARCSQTLLLEYFVHCQSNKKHTFLPVHKSFSSRTFPCLLDYVTYSITVLRINFPYRFFFDFCQFIFFYYNCRVLDLTLSFLTHVRLPHIISDRIKFQHILFSPMLQWRICHCTAATQYN